MPSTVKNAALTLLKIRPRSIAELKEKLEQKQYTQEEIYTAIKELTASGLLDDRAFTKAFINYRLARPFGFRRIIQELKAKGVDQEIIDQAVDEIKSRGGFETRPYNPEQVALGLAERRWQHLPSGLDEQKKKKRVMDFLIRRGFDVDIVIKIIKKLK